MDPNDYTLDQIAHLVESLYSPQNTSNPILISSIQSNLQRIQKLKIKGWSIADQLITYNDSLNCKFFGALTYTVNLNLYLDDLKANNELGQLTSTLLNHLNYLISNDKILNHGGLFIIKKMLSNLAILFINSFETWRNPLLTILNNILHNFQVIYPISNDALTDEILIPNVPKLPNQLINVLIITSQIVAEEIMKRDSNIPNVDKSNLHKVIHENLFVTTELLLVQVIQVDTDFKLLDTWLGCLNSWIQYSSAAEFDSVERYDFTKILKLLVELLFKSSTNNIEISNKLIETLYEIMDINPTFIKHELKRHINFLLFGEWGLNYYQFLNESEDVDSLETFIRLVISFSESDMINLAYQLNDPLNDSKFQFMITLTRLNPSLRPIKDEKSTMELIDFWSQFIDVFISDDDRLMVLLNSDQERFDQLNKKAQALFSEITQIYWGKIHVDNEQDSNDKDFKDEFRVYRRDVADLFETVYPIVREPLYHNLVENVLSSLSQLQEHSNKNNSELVFSNIESSLYLINSLSNNFTENSVSDLVLSNTKAILDSNLLNAVIGQRQDTTNISNQLIHSTIQFLSSIDWFYKNPVGLPYLSQILNFLFQVLLINKFELISSKAISKICDDCRLNLVEFLPNFENIIYEMINNINVESLIRQRIINSYSSILQSVKNPELQCLNLLKVFELIGTKTYQLITTISQGGHQREQEEELIEYLISLVTCIGSISKGMQLPDEVEEIYEPEEIESLRLFWSINPKAQELKLKILGIINNISINNNNTPILNDNLRVMEEIVTIFQNGLTETKSNGPFVFDENVILEFTIMKFETLNKTYNSYYLLFNLFASLITSNYQAISSSDSIYQTLDKIFIKNLSIIQNDPDSIQSSINLFSTILSKKPMLLITSPPTPQFETILQFSISNLLSSEKFVLKSCSSFWTILITLKKGSKAETVTIQRLFNETALGSSLILNTMKGLISAQRSNLDYFVDILKAVVVKYPLMVKNWLLQSFEAINQDRTPVIPLTKCDLFIKKLVLTRGLRSANALIKDFWVDLNNLGDFET